MTHKNTRQSTQTLITATLNGPSSGDSALTTGKPFYRWKETQT